MVPALTVMLVGLVLFFGIATPTFFALNNFRTIVSNLPVIAIMAVGMTFVLLVGGLDISVGSILGFTAINVVLFHKLGLNAPSVVMVSLLIGATLGSINALIITRVGVNPVITTLGMMAFAHGMASWFTLRFEILKVRRIFDSDFGLIANMYLPNKDYQIIPITLIYIIVLYAAAAFVLKYTRYGRNVYAVGSNEHAARLAGINTTRIKFISYVISGVTASIAAVILVAQLSIGHDSDGQGTELDVITAVVLGGVSLSGGKGNLLGVIIAVVILGVIGNGMVQFKEVTGISEHWTKVAKGGILILAISIDAARTMALRRRQRVRQ
jgi:ribose/xylose/arabinose/galactoside ABC-type transport system permease subunit